MLYQTPLRLVVSLLVIGLGLPATGSAQRRGGGEEITVFAVEVPVQVTVKGAPARGLGAENFEVIADGKAQTITGFDVVDLHAPGAVAQAPSGRRHFLLLFDLANADPTSLMRARDAARELAQEALHPSDLAAVATYGGGKGSRLILGFTPDRTQLAFAVETLGLVDTQDRVAASEPLELMVAGATDAGGGRSGGGAAAGLGGMAEAEMRQALQSLQRVERQDQINQVLAYTSGLEGLAQLMDSVAGRKYVVLLSQGFDMSLLTGTSGVEAAAEDREAALSGEYWRVDQQERYGDTRGRNALEDMLDAFRRSDCTIHAVDIGGLGEGSLTSNREALFNMAEETGGRLYENFSDPGAAMGEMLEETSVTYVLTFEPRGVQPDGRFHKIKVRLEDGPKGARLTYRPGYYAPRPWSERPEAARMLSTTQLLVAGETGGELAAGTAMAPFRMVDDRGHVPVVISVDGASILSNASEGSAELAFYAYAFDEAGQIRDFVAQNVTLDLSQVKARLANEPLKFVGDLILPAGRHRVRVLVQTPRTGRHWVGETSVNVTGGASPTLLPPLFPEPMTAGVVARASASAAKTQGLPFPFTMGEEFFLPDGLPELVPGTTQPVVLAAYGLPAGDPTLTAELLGTDGKRVAPVTTTLRQRLAGETAGQENLVLELDPGKVPPGRYTLRLSIEGGAERLTSSATVRVAS